MPAKVRADELAVELGLAGDVARARAMIMAGLVVATWPSGQEHKVEKAGDMLPVGSTLRRAGEDREFVSRAGGKLDGALDAFGIDVGGRVCADIGISTGGFTDCLFRRGALRVHGVDVSYVQVAWKIRSDPRVVLHERTNARLLPPRAFGENVSFLVADVSFISLAAILPALVEQLEPRTEMVLLVKPQFELEREAVGEGGIVRDPALRRAAVDRVLAAATTLGLATAGDVESSVPGRDGNIEHLVHLVRT